jgi:hypothetical protein
VLRPLRSDARGSIYCVCPWCSEWYRAPVSVILHLSVVAVWLLHFGAAASHFAVSYMFVQVPSWFLCSTL